MTRTLLICDCMGSQTVDRDAISAATGVTCSRLFTGLCDGQIDQAAKAMQGGEVTIACRQEAPRFRELAEELGVEVPGFVDLRDRAGWSDQGADATAKMAASQGLRRPARRAVVTTTTRAQAVSSAHVTS